MIITMMIKPSQNGDELKRYRVKEFIRIIEDGTAIEFRVSWDLRL